MDEMNVKWERTDDRIGILTINTAGKPVNVLNADTLEDIRKVLVREIIPKQHDLRGLIITSIKPGMFIAGADINEIRAIRTKEAAHEFIMRTHWLFNKIEELPFPVVAAINGVCLGGGLELALVCHYRVAADHPSVKIGLPETQLGIIPGFGGTQRLPRLVGMTRALDVILKGKTYGPQDAKRMRIVDDVVSSEDFLTTAINYTASVCCARPTANMSPRKTRLERMPGGPVLIAKKAKRIVQSGEGRFYPALEKAIDAVCMSDKLFGLGLAFEADAVSELAVSRTARCLLWLGAETELGEAAKRVVDKKIAKPAQNVGVIGGGTMGSTITYALLLKDFPVILKELNEDTARKAHEAVKALFAEGVALKKITQEKAAKRLALFTVTSEYGDLAAVDLVIETVAIPAKPGEDPIAKNEEKKREIVAIMRGVNPGAVIASNSSSFRISKMGDGVVGMHFFNPAHLRPLVEVVRGDTSSEEDVMTVAALALRMGKIPVIVADTPGFLVNRVLSAGLAEAGALVRQGVSIEAIDKAMEDFGMKMGPFRTLDEVGLDIASFVGGHLAREFPDRIGPALNFDRFIAAGFLGKKNNKGFWFPGGKKVNKKAVALLNARHLAYGSKRMPAQEIVDRIRSAIVNEMRRCLDDHVIDDPRLADLAMIMGIGFPPFRGGPLADADDFGINRLVNTALWRASYAGDRSRLDPPETLREMATENKIFRSDLA